MTHNCWNCKYKGEVPGSAHICCNHPVVEIDQLKMIMLLQLAKGIYYENPTHIKLTNKDTEKEHNFIEISEQGFKGGWASYPINFDPTWIEKCMGYETST